MLFKLNIIDNPYLVMVSVPAHTFACSIVGSYHDLSKNQGYSPIDSHIDLLWSKYLGERLRCKGCKNQASFVPTPSPFSPRLLKK